MAHSNPSPFLVPGPTSSDKCLAIISLKRDLQVPTRLRAPNPSDPSDEITNTRFGSFPHSTLLNLPWGSQVVASKVETANASRGRKRKRDPKDEAKMEDERALTPAFEAASSGFAHILSPTPELWTVSLPHRTQIVYTPDYSFILQRLRLRPGETVIEAGAGSGSFTHAAARAVFGKRTSIPEPNAQKGASCSKQSRRAGRVCSFEYHEPRYQDLQKEIKAHGLDSIVIVTHRDVYEGGFTLENGESPVADAIFLDLPAPWTALKQLTRSRVQPDRPSPLNPHAAIRICTFSPCIEQVEQTINAMRELGWIEIKMFETQHRRIDVRRELTSLNYEGLRGVNATAASVEEAVGRLRDLDHKFQEFYSIAKRRPQVQALEKYNNPIKGVPLESKKTRLDRIKEQDKERKVWREGTLVHRSEQELKTHTSFLVFAILPRAWSEEDEERCRKRWGAKTTSSQPRPADLSSRKYAKMEASNQDGLDKEDDPMAES